MRIDIDYVLVPNDPVGNASRDPVFAGRQAPGPNAKSSLVAISLGISGKSIIKL